jgi:hypothetical protein
MTPSQTNTVAQLKADGFEVQSLANIVQLKRGADIRVVRQDGSVVRGRRHEGKVKP